jgi:phage-related protein
VPSAATVAELAVVVSADVSQAEKGLADLGTKVGNAGSALQSAFAGAAVAGIAGVAAGLTASVVAATDFEKTMSGVKAVSGATADEMAALQQTALDLGAKTAFSASEAGKGIEELVKGGLSVQEAMIAAESTLNLAAAGGISVADSATIAANALAQFNQPASEMAHVADLIAGAANASALDVGQFKYSLQAAGAVAATVGFSFEDLAEGIAVMGKAGITGSDAGTSLKTMMLNLQPATNAQRDEFRRLGLETTNLQAGLDALRKQGIEPQGDSWGALNDAFADWQGISRDHGKWTKENVKDYEKWAQQTGTLGSAFFDATGKVKPMADVAEILKTSMSDMSEAQRLASLEILFGSDAIRAGAVLAKEGAAGFNDMAAAMGKVTAESVGAEKLNNLAGSVEQLKGSLETMGIMIGLELLPILKDFVDALTGAANDAMPAMQEGAKALAATFKEWLPVLQALGKLLWENRDAIVAVVAALATFVVLTTVVGWITGIVTAISAITAAISASGGVLAALGALVALLGGPVTLIIAAIALAVAALAYAWQNNWGDIQGKTEAVVEWLGGVPGTIADAWASIVTATDELVTSVTDAWADIKTATTNVWNAITSFLTDWWREIVVVLAGPIGLLAVLVIDHWDEIKLATETIFRAIANILTAIWGEIYEQVIKPKLDAISTTVSDAWAAIRTTVETAIRAVQTVLADTWAAIATTTTETLNAFLTFVRDTIFEPLREAITTRISAVQTALALAWQAISDKAHEILDPVLAYIRDTIFTPIKTAVETAMAAVELAFTSAVNAVKTVVDTTMEGIKTAWEGMWNAISKAAESPAAALQTLKDAVQRLKDIMPDWLIPHSPTPLQIGIEGIMSAVRAMDNAWSSMGSAIRGASGEIAGYITQAARSRGIDPIAALKIAQHEGGLQEYNKVGKFDTGWSWWPFQLHYGGEGYEHFGTTAGMGNDFTRKTGWAPGDADAWKDSIDFALDHARRHGWSAWYGRGPAGVGAWEGIPGHAAGGWAGLNGPELAWLGERGPEYVIPNAALSAMSGATSATQAVSMPIVIGGRTVEELWITGRDLAIRRGRVPGAGAAAMGSLG